MSASKTKDRGSPDDPPRQRLGRGLAALLADSSAQAPETPDLVMPLTVPVEFLRPNPRNPRRQFDPDDLHDLAESIRAKGIIQPIVVRPIKHVAGSYEIIAGERRWRAAQAAQLTDVPVVVLDVDDRDALAFAIIENVQRADLNAIEEGRGYERLSEEFGYSQSELSRVVGKSRSHVANTIRLLKLPEDVAAMVVAGALSAGHARALLTLPNPGEVARRVVDEGLTVRDVEALAQAVHRAPEPAGDDPVRPPSRVRNPDDVAIARAFSAALGLRVSHRRRGSDGELRIRYGSEEQLKQLRRQLRIAD